MTGCAVYRHTSERGRETIALGIKPSSDAGRVTIRTHAVPTLQRLIPIQSGMPCLSEFLIEVIPLLPTQVFGPRVKRKRRHLYLARFLFDQILLERTEAEGVANLIYPACLRPAGILERNHKGRWVFLLRMNEGVLGRARLILFLNRSGFHSV